MRNLATAGRGGAEWVTTEDVPSEILVSVAQHGCRLVGNVLGAAGIPMTHMDYSRDRAGSEGCRFEQPCTGDS